MRLCCGFSALQRFRRSLVILFRFFTSFVSFSVIRLSFSSFYFSSVDSGCVASLPGLGLLFYWEIKSRGVGGFFQNYQIIRSLETGIVIAVTFIQPGLGRGLNPPPQYLSYPDS
jgi:hypothetical protein